MYYLVQIGYETENVDSDGNPRLQKLKYAVEAESVEEASLIAARYSEGDIRGSEWISIAKMPIECIIDKQNTPEYYKEK